MNEDGCRACLCVLRGCDGCDPLVLMPPSLAEQRFRFASGAVLLAVRALEWVRDGKQRACRVLLQTVLVPHPPPVLLDIADGAPELEHALSTREIRKRKEGRHTRHHSKPQKTEYSGQKRGSENLSTVASRITHADKAQFSKLATYICTAWNRLR